VGQFEGAVDGRPIRGTVAVVAVSCPRTSQQRWDVATVSGVVRQWRGWPHRADSDGDDRSRRPDVMAWPCIGTQKTFEGATGPPSRARRVSRTGAGGIVSLSRHWPCRTMRNSGGDGLPRELAKQRRGVIPWRVRVVARPCCVRALNARTRVREQVRVGTWEMRAWVPSNGADPTRGGAQPSSEGTSFEGRVEPSGEADPT
jgi:hypothetical protein